MCIVSNIKRTNLRSNQPKNVSLLQPPNSEISQYTVGWLYRYTEVVT